jgi:hypothetical protein
LLSLEIEIKFTGFLTRKLLEILYSVVGTVHSSSSSSINNNNKNGRRVPDGNQILATGFLTRHCTKLLIKIIIIIASTITVLCLRKRVVRGINTDQSGLPHGRFYRLVETSNSCSDGFFKGEIVRMFNNRYCHRA